MDETPTEQVHETRLFERTPRSRYGIKALGSAADGEFSIFIGEQKISAPAKKRSQKVTRRCEELQNMLTMGMTESPHHAVWLLLTKSAAHKLDCDARVCPWSELCDAAEK